MVPIGQKHFVIDVTLEQSGAAAEFVILAVDEDLVAYFMVLKQTQIGIIVGLAGLDALNKGRVRDARALSLAGGAHVQSAGLLGHVLRGGPS